MIVEGVIIAGSETQRKFILPFETLFVQPVEQEFADSGFAVRINVDNVGALHGIRLDHRYQEA